MFKFEFINSVDFPNHYDFMKQYTTKVIDFKFTKTDDIIQLEYVGEEYNSKNPQCMFPVREEIDWLIHPFVD